MFDSALELEPHCNVLRGHCYRMLGSATDADDAVQETLVRAWKGYDHFDARSSLRTWLYRIATNVCLDILRTRKSRVRPIDEGNAGKLGDPLQTQPASYWIEPIADASVLSEDLAPDERLVLRQSVRLAFVAALQRLPPKQRAAVLLTEVLGLSSNEAAQCLETTVPSLNSALQRARATLSAVPEPQPLTPEDERVVDEYVAAFERYDLEQLQSLLKRDAVLSMPPFALWLRGTDHIREWMLGPGAGCRGSRLVRTWACGLPAFAQYRVNPAGGYRPWALVVLETDALRVSSVTSFLDVESIFPRFGLPLDAPP